MKLCMPVNGGMEGSKVCKVSPPKISISLRSLKSSFSQNEMGGIRRWAKVSEISFKPKMNFKNKTKNFLAY